MSEYRWCKDYAINRIFTSLMGWFFIIGFPGVPVWINYMDKPYEGLVGGGIVALILGATALHSRKYWRRFADRSVQVALRPEGVWARQLQGRTIGWEEIFSLKGLEEEMSKDMAVIYLRTSHGDLKLDLTGLDAPMTRIFREIEARYRN